MGLNLGAALVGGSIIGGLFEGKSNKDAISNATRAQLDSTNLAIEEQRRQYDEIQKLLAPYIQSGNTALTEQMNFLGLGDTGTQDEFIRNIENSPQFQSLTQQGENAILQNASATGGLRGGNTQAALAQFRPNILSSLIDQQYSRLSGLTNLGQASATGQANFGQNSSNAVGQLFQRGGNIRANDVVSKRLADRNTYDQTLSSVTEMGKMFSGGGF